MMNASFYPQMTAARRVVSLDGMWKVSFDSEKTGMERGFSHGFESKELIPVPSSFNDLYTEKSRREFVGNIWYETSVTVPEEWKGKQIGIRVGAATHRAEVYCNGILCETHEGGFLPFCADITNAARYSEPNTIVICVNNELSMTTLPIGFVKESYNGTRKVQANCDFFNYAGLNRQVWLVAVPKTSITDFTVVHEISDLPKTGEVNAVVHYSVEAQGLTGGETFEVLVYGEDGELVAKVEEQQGEIFLKNVHLWQVRQAYLYHFQIRILRDSKLVDEYSQEIGIRTVAICGNEIQINGKPVYLKGFGKHEDADVSGRGLQLPYLKRDFELMKWIEANSFRTSHYPYCEEVYQMADREGFLVIDEVAAVGFMKAFGVVQAAAGGSQVGFFEESTVEELKKNHLASIQELINRDKNHACVIAWSLMNEPDTRSAGADAYFEEIFQRAGEMDPQKRPKTFAMEFTTQPNSKIHRFCDILTINRYYGWYIKGGYDLDDAITDLKRELEQWGQLEKQKPMVVTEYGTDTLSTEHKLPSVMWTQEYQTEMIRRCNEAFDEAPFIKGEQVWNFADFQTGEGIIRVDGNKKGIFTRERQPKDCAFYLKERWEKLPLDYKAGEN